MNRSKIKRTLLQGLEESGRLLKGSLLKRQIVHKKSELSLVTDTDKRAEKIILRLIRKNFPGHAYLTEESPPAGRSRSRSRWIIDPLDGTTNFAHTFPVACVSIAYEEDGCVEIGGVLDPFRGELFFAERGKGATLNGKKIRVSKTKSLSESLLATGFPYDRRENVDAYLAIFKQFLLKVHDLRRAGAAALDLCSVACGRFDGYWECGLAPWDKAAGALILREAGGCATNFSGQPLTLEDPQNVASNGLIHPEMLEALREFRSVGK